MSDIQPSPSPLREVTLLALKLGTTAFGGPAAHIAMLRQEAVVRRGWLPDAEFVDLLGATNLIPGPNSTEMVMHIGHVRAGRRGLLAAGAAFILPAATITLMLAWLYVDYGTTPGGEWLMWGIKPVVLAVVAHALWGLSGTALKGTWSIFGGLAVAAGYLLGVNELVLLFAGALGIFAVRRAISSTGMLLAAWWPINSGVRPPFSEVTRLAGERIEFGQLRLFLTFLKIGAVLYGSGYVLIAFLRNDFVVRYGWLTEQQLLDAVAVGQVTPGPVFTTATFIGYVTGGIPGAILATTAIFLPAFLFVGLTHPLVRLMRSRPVLGELLDAVNVAAIGLMAAVAITLARDAVSGGFTAAICLVSAAALIRLKVNATWLIAAGALAGAVRWGLG